MTPDRLREIRNVIALAKQKNAMPTIRAMLEELLLEREALGVALANATGVLLAAGVATKDIKTLLTVAEAPADEVSG